MINSRTLIPISCLLVTGALAMAQTPVAAPAPMAPTAPPAASPAARPAPAPRAYVIPMDAVDLDRAREMAEAARDRIEAARDQIDAARPLAPPAQLDQDTLDRIREMAQEARAQAQAAMPPMPAMAPMPPMAAVQLDQDTLDRIREQAEAARDQSQTMRDRQEALRDQAQALREAVRVPVRVGGGMGSGFGNGAGGGMNFSYNFNTPMAFAQSVGIAGRRGGMSDDRLYDAGLRALDSHRWDEALEDFNQIASHAGARADGGWFWKAYTLNRLGRRDESLAAIAELRKSYATSRWLDEAKALEIEVKQKSGQPVSPESESDEDLKLMALNGIMQSDPDRAIPLVENILKGSGSHKLKSSALFVLAQNGSPRAQQIVEQIARGGGNPDLQVKAIEYLGQRRRQSNNNQNQLLMEIYNSSNDTRVKSVILDAFRNSHDVERLGQIAKSEKNLDLRMMTYNQLGDVSGQPELWQIYQTETSPDGKIAILRVMHHNGNADKLVEVIKTEKDPKVRRTAIEVLANQDSGAPERLVAIYGSEQDPELRRAIVDSLSGQRNAKYLIDLARAEKDTKLKLRIVERLSNMHSKEAADYLLELLK